MYTLLDMTKKILASLDSDEVSSLDETAESIQVVDIIETTYYDIISTLNLPKQYGLTRLTPLGSSQPVAATLADGVANVLWIKYQTDPDTDSWKFLEYLIPQDFLDMTHNYKDMDNAVTYNLTSNSVTHEFSAIDDREPYYWTSLDDTTVLLDAWDSALGTAISAANTQVYGEMEPVFQRLPSWEPPVAQKIQSLIFNEAKRQAFVELKQIANPIADQRARRGWIHSMNNKLRLPTRQNMGIDWANRGLPRYGRK